MISRSSEGRCRYIFDVCVMYISPLIFHHYISVYLFHTGFVAHSVIYFFVCYVTFCTSAQITTTKVLYLGADRNVKHQYISNNSIQIHAYVCAEQKMTGAWSKRINIHKRISMHTYIYCFYLIYMYIHIANMEQKNKHYKTKFSMCDDIVLQCFLYILFL